MANYNDKASSVPHDFGDTSTNTHDHDQTDHSTLEAQDTKVNIGEEVTFPDGGLQAWSVVAATSCILFCTFGYANAFGVLQEFYSTHQLKDESASNISWIGSINIFILLGGAVLGGPLFDRWGGKVIWPPAIIYIFSVMMTSLCTKFWQFMLAQGILGGLSMGMLMGPSMASTGQYFKKKRGAAMGLAVAGSSLGGIVFPILLSHMLYSPKLGFAWTIRILGFIMAALILPSCLVIRARLPSRKGRFFLPEAFKIPVYDATIVSVFLMMVGVFTPFFYLPTYAVQHGMSKRLADNLLSILNAASFLGRVIPGILADKLGALNMMMASGLCAGIMMFCWRLATTNASIIAFSALYGFFSGAIISLMGFSLMSSAKNPQNIGTYMGMGMSIISLAALIGPPINGALVTKYHTFEQAQDFSGSLVVVGAISLLIAKKFKGGGMFSKQ